jgi:6-phosphogluconate dehydrogenase (decarboxylating)
MSVNVEICEDPQQVARAAADWTAKLARETIALHGRFILALSGGSTPRLYHQALAERPDIDWSHVVVVFSDERRVPPDHADSNYRMAEETLLSNIPAKDHRVESDAAAYERVLLENELLPVDLVILGMGEDGHTASLFPGRETGPGEWVAEAEAPQESPSKQRVTFTYSAIARARNAAVLVTGAAKAERLAGILETLEYPLGRVLAARSETSIFVDRAAAANLKEKTMDKADFGLIGLGVMGQNLALNIEEKGFSIAVNNRSVEKVEEFLKNNPGKKIVGANSLQELADKLKRPRRIIIMVKAGAAVDSTIDALKPSLSPGDVVIDGGNEFFTNTERREKALSASGLHFLGMGVSGGEEGARHGPSMMPGGAREAYEKIEDVVTKIAAQVSDGPCVTYIGPGGAGHYVKMVHNGIEYGDMQLIAETYDVLKNIGGLSNAELADTFDAWNRAELESFLIEITAKIFRKKDELTGQELLDVILDTAQMKGTGSWTVKEGADLTTPIATIASSVDARIMSGLHSLRQKGSKLLQGPKPQVVSAAEKADIIADTRAALYAAKACSYAQGLGLLAKASETHRWNLQLGEIARIWKGGCIIRAAFLGRIQEAYGRNNQLENLLFDPSFGEELAARQTGWRKTITRAINAGIGVSTMTASLGYYDGLRRARLPMNLTQAQRDLFGAHTYQRTDREGVFHTEW